jgi:hypothetical protein
MRKVLRLVFIFSLIAAGCGVSSRQAGKSIRRQASGRSSSSISKTYHWFIAASALKKLEDTAGKSWLGEHLNPENATLIVAPSQMSKWPAWSGHMAIDSTSLDGVRRALAVVTSGDFVILDLEHWSRTPLDEQLNAAETYKEAFILCQSRKVPLIAAPATDLALAIKPGERITTGFLESGVIGAAAAAASEFEIQAQGLEANPARYLNYVHEVVAQARASNPNINFVLGLSTNPNGQRVSASELIADVRESGAISRQYWLNIPQGGPSCPRCGIAQPQVAIALLDQLNR